MKVFLIAGEASGDRLGAALMAGLKTLVPEVSFSGVGGTEMQREGLQSLFPMSELSVMGIAEIAPKYFHLKRRIRETAEHVITSEPDVLITIDSPDFCLRVARLVKARTALRTVHYVAPSVWAWRPGRAARMVGVVDQVLALLPFEPPYIEAHGIRCDFTGHPVVAQPVANDKEASAFRGDHDIPMSAPLLLALPGSRRGEITRLSDTFGAAISQFVKKHPEARVVLPVAPGMMDLAAAASRSWAGSPVLLDPGAADAAQVKRAAFRAADIALAASGTVSLELAASGTPMVIAYDMNWLSRRLIARMLKVDTVTLVNLVSGTRAVPEFLGPACQPDAIARSLSATLDSPDAQRNAMRETMIRLGAGGEAPGLRAARAVLDGLGLRPE